jgi:TetR/AcrR family transcriptional regulator, regulator of cefoperazone and chloramphenicol sensitivity
MRAAKPKTKTRNRAVKEQALIQAATKLFAAGGYESTKTREIAALAGCAEGLIHRYFKGKAGLLLAIVQSRITQEVSDISAQIPLAGNLKDEIRQLARWEVERMWRDRDFLKIVMPRALLDPAIGRVVNRMGPERRCEIISARLRTFKKSKDLRAEDIRAIAEFVGSIGYLFGFLRPVLLQQNRKLSRQTAGSITDILVRSL